MGVFDIEIFKEKQQRPGTPVGFLVTLIFPIILIMYAIFLIANESKRSDISSTSVTDLATTRESTMVSFECTVGECLLLTYSPDGHYCANTNGFPAAPVHFGINSPSKKTKVEYPVCYGAFGETPRTGVLFVGDFTTILLTDKEEDIMVQDAEEIMNLQMNTKEAFDRRIAKHDIVRGQLKTASRSQELKHLEAVENNSPILQALSPGACASSEVECADSSACIPVDWECDGIIDCADNSDEANCVCTASQFTCVASGFCITNAWACDGMNDCADGSDEDAAMCASFSPSSSSSSSYSSSSFYSYGGSSGSCASWEWMCANGDCVYESFVCDGVSDCSDGSDENCNGGYVAGNCGTDFECVSDGMCISQFWECDGISDCADNSDEKNCKSASSSTQSQYFDAYFGSSVAACFDLTWADCSTNSACARCSSTGAVPAGGFDCFPKSWKCDNVPDCTDGSDENSCTGAAQALVCSPACGNHGVCVDEATNTCICDEGWVSGSSGPCSISTVIGKVGGGYIVRIPTGESTADVKPTQNRLSMSRTYNNIDDVVSLKVFVDAGSQSPLTTNLVLKSACTTGGKSVCGTFPTSSNKLASAFYVADPLFFEFTINSGKLGVLGILGAIGGVLGALYGILGAFVGIMNKLYYKVNPNAMKTELERKVDEAHAAIEMGQLSKNKVVPIDEDGQPTALVRAD